ncbi:MAG TPA: indolepyruvate ferredoxin oxidoreductase family protein [Acidimicrobiales bacterium]|nr:indolepyruvate ferredoxin oxidoreductase family protein [Acidimicrobiales bacterium]
MSAPAPVPSDRYRVDRGRVLLSGVQAVVRLLGDQAAADAARGLDVAQFVTGYPGSPLAGLDLELARSSERLARWRVVHRPGLNEELAATAVAGSQLATIRPDRTVEGVVALWYAKAPGLDRASDALRHGNLMGAGPRGGVLVVVGDDPQAKSSSVPSSSEPSLFALALPFLSPADPQEVLDLGRHGVAMSRASGLWVGLRLSASVADATQSVEVGPDRVDPVEPDHPGAYGHRVSAQLLGANLIELERSLYGTRLEVARLYGVANGLNRVTHASTDDTLGIVAAGPAYLSVLGALARVGYREADLATAGVRLLKVSMPYPMDETVVRDFARGLDEILVVEDKRPFLETMVKAALAGDPAAPRVVGKRDEAGRPLVPATGEVEVDALAEVIAARLVAGHDDARAAAFRAARRPPLPPALPVVRGAYFCSGCPHNSSVRVPEGTCVGSGSGCHGLAIQMDPRRVGDVVGRFQMGGEGAMWNGMAPFVATSHFVQNLGDGTYAHSGSLAVRAAVAAGAHITFKLLVNGTVAMTGGQPVNGGRSLAELATSLRAEGVSRVMATSDDPRRTRRALPRWVEVWPRERLLEVERRLAEVPGVTVLLHDQGCAVELRRRRHRGLAPTPERRVHINTLVCEGCGDCGVVSNCLSVRPVETALGAKRQIHQESCNLDYSCLAGRCPALTTVRVGRARAPEYRPDDLDIPEPATSLAACRVRVTGIGGTGVVTVAQVIAFAAHLEGRYVRVLDQTGIAQKGGAVVSDLRLSERDEARGARLGEGECDLYLGGDALVAATSAYLGVTDPARTLAVVSSATVPVGRQVADPTSPVVAPEELRARVDACTRRDENVWLDAAAVSRAYLGEDTFANVVLLGAAFQRGVLGLRAASLHAAIEANGVEVERNLAAFALGRRAVLEPSVRPDPRPPVEPDELLRVVGASPGGDLESMVATRLVDLRASRGEGAARRYGEIVGRARAAEAALGYAEGPFVRAVAEQLHRLSAYKDEYEVARLLLAEASRAEVAETFGVGAATTFHLSLTERERAAGHKHRVGPGSRWVLRALRAGRGLRETRLDPFGRSPLRREERRVRDEYVATVEELIAALAPDTYERAVALADAPALVRGFGPVKAAAIAAYDARRAALLEPVSA